MGVQLGIALAAEACMCHLHSHPEISNILSLVYVATLPTVLWLLLSLQDLAKDFCQLQLQYQYIPSRLAFRQCSKPSYMINFLMEKA